MGFKLMTIQLPASEISKKKANEILKKRACEISKEKVKPMISIEKKYLAYEISWIIFEYQKGIKAFQIQALMVL